MLARFAAALQSGQLRGIGQADLAGVTAGGGGTMTINDNCAVQ